MGSLLVNQGISAAMEHGRSRKLLLTLGLIANIGLLFYFKYFNFFVDNCNFFFHTDWQIEKLHCRWVSAFHIPADFLCGGPLQGRSTLLQSDGLCLLCDIFPQLIAGPIVLHSEFIPTLQARKNRKPDWEMFYDGVALFVLGFGKKYFWLTCWRCL